MRALLDLLLFRKLLMPAMLQVLFWGGVGGTFYGAYWLYSQDHWAWWLALLGGVLVTRLIFESLLLRYQTYVCLMEIRDSLLAGPGKTRAW